MSRGSWEGEGIASLHVAPDPVVSALWRYPVKSMQGEPVDHLDVGPSAVAGDRAWGVIDAGTGLLVSAKRDGRLLEAFARTDGDDVLIRLPDGAELVAGAPEADRALSAWLDREVVLRRPGGEAAYDMTLDPPNDDAEVYEIPTPPGTFLDLAALHVLTTASVEQCRAARPDIDWDVRRFRPNVLVDTGAETDAGFPEDAWVGQQVAIGDVVIHGDMRTMRCAMPLRPQPEMAAVGSPELARELDVYRTMAEIHSNDLGLYASVVTPGRIQLGDRVVPR